MKTFKEYINESSPISVDTFTNIDVEKDSFNTYDVLNEVRLLDIDLENTKIKFHKVGGECVVVRCNLTNLDWAPKWVGEDFNVNNNNLTTLEGSPEHVTGSYWANKMPSLISLKGAPRKVGDVFIIEGCVNIKSLEHIPEEAKVYGLQSTGITSLVGIHKFIKRAEIIQFSKLEITEGGIGILLINNIEKIHYTKKGKSGKALSIIEKYLGKGKSAMLQCQDELIEAGLEEYTKL